MVKAAVSRIVVMLETRIKRVSVDLLICYSGKSFTRWKVVFVSSILLLLYHSQADIIRNVLLLMFLY